MPNAVISCHDVHCHSNEHLFQLQEYADSIANASLLAAQHAIPLINAGKDTGGNSHRIPCWNEFVSVNLDLSQRRVYPVLYRSI